MHALAVKPGVCGLLPPSGKHARWLSIHATALSIFLSAGCTRSESELSLPHDPSTRAVSIQPRVVVANGGGGVNIYHEIFRKGGLIYGNREPSSVTPDVLAEFGIDDAHIIDVTRTGNPDADYASDRERLNSTEIGRPYWVRGTNLIVYPGPSLDDDAHFVSLNANSLSTRSTSDILQGNPEAVVVFVENAGPFQLMELISYHPSIDLAGLHGPNFPILPDDDHYLFEYEAALFGGKLALLTVDSRVPYPHQLDFGVGAWWNIAVGYYDHQGTNGREPLTPVLPDFVSDTTLITPAYCSVCQAGYLTTTLPLTGDSSGAVANYAAGVVSSVILELRRIFGHLGGIRSAGGDGRPVLVEGPGFSLTNWQLRRALEETSAVPTVTDFNPAVLDSSSALQPCTEQAGWNCVGWGLVSPEIIEPTVDYILAENAISARSRKLKAVDHCEVMTASMDVRKEWSERIRNTLHFGPEVGPVTPLPELGPTDAYIECRE